MTIAEKLRQSTDDEMADLLCRFYHALIVTAVDTGMIPDKELIGQCLTGRYMEESSDAES